MIQIVEKLAEVKKQPILIDVNHFFEWTLGFEIEEEHVEEAENVLPVNGIKEEQEIEVAVIEVNIQEGAYITDVESTNDNKDLLQHDSF